MPAPLPISKRLQIFPSRAAADQAVELSEHGCTTTQAFQTFTGLVATLVGASQSRYASRWTARLLVRAVLLDSEVAELRELGRDPYQVRAVHRALAELREAGVTAQALERSGVPMSLARPVVELLGHYERALGQRGLVDDADRMREAVLAVARGDTPGWLSQLESVRVEGGGSLMGGKLDLLSAWASRGCRVQVRLPWDPGRSHAFAWPEATLHAIEARGHTNIEVETDTRIGSGPLALLRAAQFTDRVVHEAPVRVLACASGAEHVRAIAARVLRWLSSGVPRDQIVVAVLDLDQLGTEVVRQLERWGVPAWSRRGAPVGSTPAARGLELALRLPPSDFSREELLELLQVLQLEVETPQASFSPGEVARLLRSSGARNDRVLGFHDALRAAAHRAALRRKTSPDARVEWQLAEGIGALREWLLAVPETGGLESMLSTVAELGARLRAGLVALLERESAWPPAQARFGSAEHRLLLAHARLAESISAVDELLAVLRQASRVAGSAEAFDRDELAQTLRLLFSESRLAPQGLSAGSVRVVALDELVETHASHVLLAGIDPGAFPRALAPDPILSDEVRAAINHSMGMRLLQAQPTSGRAALAPTARDCWLWLEALAAATDELVVTCTSSDQTDESRSEVVDELLRSCGQTEPEPAAQSYGELWPASIDHGVNHLAFLSASGARTKDSTCAPAALEAVLAEAAPDRVASLGVRSRRERALRSWPAVVEPVAAAVRSLLTRELFTKVQSASKLDTLGQCGFRHFASAILGLESELVPTLGADAREQGTAAHAALRLVYEQVVRTGGLASWHQDPQAGLRRADELVLARADEILAEVAVHPALRRAALEQVRDVVRVQLGFDLSRWATPDGGKEPIWLEYSFDDRPGAVAQPLRLDAPDGSRHLLVRGSIDRVDRGPGMLAALDYKRTVKNRTAGRHFQLPIYALVAARDAPGSVEQVEAAWIKLREGKRKQVEQLASDPAELRAEVSSELWARIDQLEAGLVPPDPEPLELCRGCDFAALCRFEPPVETADESERDDR